MTVSVDFSGSVTNKNIMNIIKTNPKDRPDIWQLTDVIYTIMKKSNPLENIHNLDQIDLSQVDPLPNQTQLIKIKQSIQTA